MSHASNFPKSSSNASRSSLYIGRGGGGGGLVEKRVALLTLSKLKTFNEHKSKQRPFVKMRAFSKVLNCLIREGPLHGSE